MNLLISIFTLFIFPFNLLFFLPINFSSEKNSFEAEKEIEIDKKEIRGAEKQQKETIITQDLDFSNSLQPIRKEKTNDLVLSTAHASLILDADSGTILHYSNGRERRQIASLGKIMSAIIVVENVKNLEDSITIEKEDLYIEGTKIGCPQSNFCNGQRLLIGEKLTVIDLMKAMLINSANDAAVVLAKHVSGSEEKFVKLMNEKAREIGLKDTNFCTASGLELDDEEKAKNCYSSAYDIARIASYSMKHKIIWEIFRTPNNAVITSIDKKQSHNLINTNILLDQMQGCLGGKTGYTHLAGHSLLLATRDTKNQHTIIAVLLSDPYRWQNIKKMIDWVFQSYEWK